MDGKIKKLYKIVLTGGPCGGKTTGQSRLCTFFENLGWKVYRVPETANVLLSGGIKFSELSDDEAHKFQENLLRCMLQIENTFFELGESCDQDCLIICDRGAMDAAAYIPTNKWDMIMKENGLNMVDLRDNRYNQIIHMVSAACGAEDFYTTEDHTSRREDVSLAKSLDVKASASWIGHPYFDVIDNSSDFENKICRMIAAVCQKLGLDTGDRLATNSKKRKWLVKYLPNDQLFPPFQDFDVVHNYLQTYTKNMQARLRKRGQKGHWNYTHTIRRPRVRGQVIEVKTQLSHRDYVNLLSQKDETHYPIYKKRRCFIHYNQYFQLDIYCKPCHKRCEGLVLLETYSALEDQELLDRLPKFLDIEAEVTGNAAYSMFNLSLVEDWDKSKNFCHYLKGPDEDLNIGDHKTNQCATASREKQYPSGTYNNNFVWSTVAARGFEPGRKDAKKRYRHDFLRIDRYEYKSNNTDESRCVEFGESNSREGEQSSARPCYNIYYPTQYLFISRLLSRGVDGGHY